MLGLVCRCRLTENYIYIYIYIYGILIGKLKSLAGRPVILKIKAEVMKMETMKIAVFRDVTLCNEETAPCHTKITMTFPEQVPQTSTGLNWLRSSTLVLAALNLRVLSADISLFN